MTRRTAARSLGLVFFPRFSTTSEEQWKSRASAMGKLIKIRSILDRVRMFLTAEESLLV